MKVKFQKMLNQSEQNVNKVNHAVEELKAHQLKMKTRYGSENPCEKVYNVQLCI
jgi:hypothetical protein